MSNSAPPSLDPKASVRFRAQQSVSRPAWLHSEVAQGMEQRLDWFKQAPTSWIDWEPINGGLKTHHRIQARYPSANALIIEYNERRLKEVQQELTSNWFINAFTRCIPALKNSKLFIKGKKSFSLSKPPDPTQVDLVWANMLLHLSPNPVELIKEWNKSLRVGGWVMFSCLGPDTSKELRHIYEQMGWTIPAHEFTDMHDWGDMLVEAGFADPVMDMERITLTYSTPEALIEDLRSLGGNFNYNRFPALRGRKWLQEFKNQLKLLGQSVTPPRASNGERKKERADEVMNMGMNTGMNTGRNDSTATSTPSPKIPLTFEIIYGHAFKVAPKIKVSETSAFSADDMRAMLKATRN